MTSNPVGAGQGYQVYPDALVKAAAEIGHAAALVEKFVWVDLANVFLGEYDLGLPGTATVLMPGVYGTNTVGKYNQAIERIQALSKQNVAQLKALSDALAKAAEYYESQDREFYEELKKKEGELK